MFRSRIIDAYRGRIINIHPALLPLFGGMGMYGEGFTGRCWMPDAQKAASPFTTSMKQYDSGDIIFQARCPVLPDDDTDALASRVHELEYRHYPAVISRIIDGLPFQ